MNEQQIKDLQNFVFEQVLAVNNDFNERLNAECERVLIMDKDVIFDEITPEIISDLGYQIVYTPDGGATICKHGKPVSNTIYPIQLS